jgi:hypothetical protein
MGAWEFIDEDEFAVTMNRILENIDDDVNSGIRPAVSAACRAGKQAVKTNIPKSGIRSRTGTYASSWRYRTQGRKLVARGEIGSATRAGLVHLLEKGHAKMGGGRTRAFPHVIEGKKVADRKLMEELEKAVEGALLRV